MKCLGLLFVIFLCFACSKQRRYTNYLEGDWNCTMIRLQDSEGFTFFDNAPNGTLTIGDNKQINGSIFSHFTTFQNSIYDSIWIQGIYQLELDKQEINWIQSNDTLKNRLFVITKTDLEYEYFDATLNQRTRYVFRKVD